MKPLRRLLAASLCLTFLLFVLGGGTALAAEVKSKPEPGHNTGLAAAEAISTITGVAISPLLGVSGVGAYKWYKTAPEKRANLVWYAQPWFWVPALVLVALAFVKDTFGAALPTAVKKPFDVMETIENKISGLVAAGAFVPLMAIIFKAVDDDGAWYSSMGLAMVDPASLLNILTVPFAVAAFLVVFLVSHVINVLILISPFTLVDTALKGVRLGLLATVALTSFANPYVGAVWSLCIVVVCWFLSGWAFRLFVFGTVFTWDLSTFRRARFKPEPASNWAFTSRKIGQTPLRTYGELSRGGQGELQLRYRPWLVLPARVVTLPPGDYAVGRGLFYSEIFLLGNGDEADVLTLPPRYRTHEEEVNAIYKLGGVRDAGMVKGIKALWTWLKELFGLRARAYQGAELGQPVLPLS
jgi:hypothetical protein